MAKLIYTVLMSLDGFIADQNGKLDWVEPDEEVHTFINELMRHDGTYLYGRRMYEVMAAWQTMPTHDPPSYIADFANIWRAADKLVYSRTLKAASTPRTRIEQNFEPEAVRRMKASTARPRHQRAYSRRPCVQGWPGRCPSPVQTFAIAVAEKRTLGRVRSRRERHS